MEILFKRKTGGGNLFVMQHKTNNGILKIEVSNPYIDGPGGQSEFMVPYEK